MSHVKELQGTFEIERETKNTVRNSEVFTGGPLICNTIYLQKAVLTALGGGSFPAKIRVTVEAVKEE